MAKKYSFVIYEHNDKQQAEHGVIRKIYPDLKSARTAAFEALEANREEYHYLQPIPALSKDPSDNAWCLDDYEVTGKVWFIFACRNEPEAK